MQSRFKHPSGSLKFPTLLFSHQRVSHLFSLFQESFRTQSGEVSDPADITGPLGNADCAAGIQHIERMRAFQTVIISRQNKSLFSHPDPFSLIEAKKLS
jgi:hypothetical protein